MVTLRSFAFGSWALAVLVSLPANALGQTAPQEAKAAEELFHEATKAMDRGDWGTACPRFEASLKLVRRAGTLFNLSRCAEKDGHLIRAAALWREGIAMLPVGDERVRSSQEALASLERRLAHVALVLPSGAPSDTRVQIDTAEVQLNVLVPMDPGSHVAVAREPGGVERRTPFIVLEGEQKSVTLQLGKPDEATPIAVLPKPALPSDPPPAPTPSSSNPLRTTGYVVGGAGVASLVVGAITGAMTMGKKSTVDQNCPNHVCNPTGVAAEGDGKTLSSVSTATFVGGAVAAAAGVVLVLTIAPGRSSGTTFGVNASVQRSAGFLSLSGEF